jgi:uncharacterized protein
MQRFGGASEAMAHVMPQKQAMTTQSSPVDQLLDAQRIAVIGLSDDPSRPSYYVSEYLQQAGKEIFPVNPTLLEVLNRRCYAKLDHVPAPPVDLVLVFRRPAACGEVAKEAVQIGAKGLWLQSGIRNEEAKQVCEAAGIPFVEDRCIMIEHGARRRR